MPDQELAALGIALFWLYMCFGLTVIGLAIRVKIREIRENKKGKKKEIKDTFF